jgi:VWFA-related protein
MLMLGAAGLRGQEPQQAPPPPPAPPSSTPLPPETGAIRRNVNLVDVLFTVFDRHDRIVANLSKKDFMVFDDNAQQEIRFFSRQSDLPLRVGLLLDTSNSIRQRLQFEQQAAINFLFDVMRPGKDEAFLMTVDDDPEIVQGLTSDVNRLRDAILRQRAGGGTALYDAIYKASQRLGAYVPPQRGTTGLDVRRVIVVISDGNDNLSNHARGEALEMAQRAGVVIYTISSSTQWIIPDGEVNPTRAAYRKYHKGPGDRVLEQFADDSGGRAFFPYRVQDLALSFHDIGSELRSQYSLAYVPAGRLADGKFHTIRIEADVKGLKVHARKGYYAEPPAAAGTVSDSPVR